MTAAGYRAIATTARAHLVAGFLSLFALRLALSLFRTGPLLVADETGYLTNARVLAGGVPGQMSRAPFYHGGYSLLLAPLVATGASPEHVYDAALVLNALLAAALFLLLYLLLTRVFDASRPIATLAAFVAAAYPAVTLLSQVAMSENLLFPLVVVWLLLSAKVADAPSSRAGAVRAGGAGLAAAAAYAVHGRMIVCVAVCAVYFVVLAARRLLAAAGAAVGLVCLGAGVGAARLLESYLVTHNYGGHAPDEAGQRLSSLTSLDSAASVLRNLVGQSWYVLVATLGLPVLAAIVVGRRGITGGARGRQAALALLLSLAAGLLVVSALSFPDVERSDMFVYGRYVEIVVPPLLAIAAAVLCRHVVKRREVIQAIAIVCGATVVVVALRLTFRPQRGPNRWDVSALPAPSFQLDAKALALVGVAAVVWLAIAAATTARSRVAILGVVALSFLLTSANVVRNPLLSGERIVYGSGWTDPAAAIRGPDRVGVVGYDFGAYDIFGLYAYQWFFADARFGGMHAVPTTRYFISAKDWPASHPTIRVERVWSDPNRNQALFRIRGRT